MQVDSHMEDQVSQADTTSATVVGNAEATTTVIDPQLEQHDRPWNIVAALSRPYTRYPGKALTSRSVCAH